MIEVPSPSKINLHLRVLRKRPDGYHDIATLMQKISLQDTMVFSSREEGVEITCPGFPQLENEDNIVFRAVKALFCDVAYQGGVGIVLHKRIPVGAGLGGGSSNAATTLVALNDMLRFDLSREALMAIGARLGADVPFFIYGNRAWAFGIGDRLESAADLPPLWFVLVNPRFELSTAQVYSGLNLTLTNTPINYSIPRFSTIGDLVEGLQNDLEKVSLALCPALKGLKGRLMGLGARGALMSGSGPTVYGVFEREREALRAADVLKKNEDWFVAVAASL
ncbi:MAG: 4-(cytidine 5'-diphospho)-2-C-methyl-D-erythritol kinase [Deltaproteobacteria bacterium]|nr:4-(cytidine 5'-diphospho)-2-C-methyl-D-erythritol kinase [Deltaproteobacteria bacterium]